MISGRPPKEPLYVLPHGIEVIGEYGPNNKCFYYRVRVRPHPFFPGVRDVHGGIYVHRSRVVLASKIGRALISDEHAHHIDGNRCNDIPSNLELMSSADHNRHHKTGTKHTEDSKRRIGESVRKAYKEGRMKRVYLRGVQSPMAKLNDMKVRHIRNCSESSIALANRYGVSKQVVLAVRHNKIWRHVT